MKLMLCVCLSGVLVTQPWLVKVKGQSSSPFSGFAWNMGKGLLNASETAGGYSLRPEENKARERTRQEVPSEGWKFLIMGLSQCV